MKIYKNKSIAHLSALIKASIIPWSVPGLKAIYIFASKFFTSNTFSIVFIFVLNSFNLAIKPSSAEIIKSHLWFKIFVHLYFDVLFLQSL